MKKSPSRTNKTENRAKQTEHRSEKPKKTTRKTTAKKSSKPWVHDNNPLIYINESDIHGTGVFAATPIKRSTHIGTYEGPVARTDGMHVLWVYEVDSDPVGRDGKNKLRFLNHSAKPNAEFRGFELYSIRAIKKDEEITFHYGEDWE